MSAEASKEALAEASETSISQLKGGRRVFFSSCSRKHRGISLLDGKKAVLVRQNGGRRPQRSDKVGGVQEGTVCRSFPNEGRH